MAKFNKTNTIKTTNISGHDAYGMTLKDRFVTEVLTTMIGEDKYYGSNDKQLLKDAEELAVKSPEFLLGCAVYARKEFNLRSVSHVLTSVIARFANKYTRAAIRNVVVRADDILEIMTCYQSLYGKPFPNAMKREIAVVIQRFDEQQIAKYNGGSKSLTFKDVLRITHPVPKSKEVEVLFGKILNDTLETAYTWESELSARGNKAEVWNELLNSGRLGYMAVLRNLSNIISSGADVDKALSIISDPARVKKSKQLPFRFYIAYIMLEAKGYMSFKVHMALESAIKAAACNMEQIKGRTFIAIDCSGSMDQVISKNSDVRCFNIAALFAAMGNTICEDATICYFSSNYSYMFRNDKGYQIAHYGKYDSILSIALNTKFLGGGTDMSLPMEYALNEDPTRGLKPFDRVIYFSDNECNYGKSTIQSYADKYRKKYNENLWVHGVDLVGYGTQQFCGSKFNLIAGWSEKVFQFINLAEQGSTNLVKTIEDYGKSLA